MGKAEGIRSESSGAGNGGKGGAPCVGRGRSNLSTDGLGNFGGGLSSFDGYPPHFRPKFEHLKQTGFPSSHLTRRALDIQLSKIQ